MIRKFWTMVLCLIGLSGCNDKPQSKDMIVAGEQGVRQNVATFGFAVYFTGENTPNPKTLIDRFSKKYSQLELSESGGQSRTSTQVILIEDAQVNAPLPPSTTLKYFGRGLSDTDILRLGKAERAIAFDFRLENVKNYELQLLAVHLMSDVAKAYGGYIWDNECRLVFTKEFWDAKVLPSWEPNTLVLEKNIAIHQYQEGELVRSITLGMKKFGLPDLIVQNASRHTSNSVVNTINVLGQTILENPQQVIDGSLHLSLKNLKDSSFKSSQFSGLFSNGTGEGTVYLESGKHEDGDPENTLWSLKFGDFNQKDQTVKQHTFFDQFFGSKDQLVNVNHDEELEAASREAQLKLPEMQAKFQSGLPPGDMLLVKVPFATPDGGNEWMWIEIIGWPDKTIRGILQNDPQQVPALEAGQEVTALETDVFDYIYFHSDGTKEGNETGKIIEKMYK